jgi:serine/threonine protein kinase
MAAEWREFQGDRGGSWRYDPTRPLGPSGGFGRVYAGEGKDGQPVAVKVIDARSGVSPRLLRREAEIADKLQGIKAEHLVEVLDTAQVGDELLLVMERAEGSLDDLLGERRLSEQEAINVLRDIAAGLRELHQASVIHRDLKPGNVLLIKGRWKLADFGIARDVDLGTQFPTFLGAGSRPYMAPETWRGQSPSFKTDLYSLGCLAYELLAGTRPFPGPDDDDYARQHLEEPPLSLATSNAGLARLVLRLLLKDPAGRPQDARAVDEWLAQLLAAGERAATGPLAVLAAKHAEERSLEDAEKSATEAKEARRRELGEQAANDLEGLLKEATDSISQEVPEVTFSWDGSVPRIAGPDATLEFRLHSRVQSSIEGDTMVVGMGEVFGESRRTREALRLANIVYEATEGGLYRWNLYRFRAQGIVTEYVYGPRDREHGLSVDHFIQDRAYMRGGVTHVWVPRRVALTADAIVGLYKEAMALPDRPG